MAAHFIHPTAIVDSPTIGDGTRIWANVHILADVVIGPECNICDGAFIESGARLGRGVTVKTGVSICEGVTIDDGVFIGPSVVFTNDPTPRSPRIPFVRERYAGKGWLQPTRVRYGATLGAHATLANGITVGEWAFVAAGAVVMADVRPFAFVLGNPARMYGYVCACAARMDFVDGRGACAACGRTYRLQESAVIPQEPLRLWE
jgi:acetyltransferase-like isoleucine patch superfamily enzyme